MRVPCLCTQADYECDMNYVKNKGGACDKIPDVWHIMQKSSMSEKEEDCALEGFYYTSQGYRKIPGNKCYGGVALDPIKKACTTFGKFTSIVSAKTLVIAAIVAAGL